MGFEELFPLSMFLLLFALILSGYPVAFALAGTGIAYAFVGVELELLSYSEFGFIPKKIYGVIGNMTLLAVPLFIAMGMTLEKSGIAEELLSTLEELLRGLRGGLLISLVLVGALLAASTGIVGATVITMSLLALQPMLDRKYSKELATGTIAASGTLGQIVPPSIVLVILGDMMNIAVADLFAAAVFPGLMLVLFYLGYVLLISQIRPELAPALERIEKSTNIELFLRALKCLLPPILMMVLVLGSILTGVASPTESAACGATAAIILATLKKKLSLESMWEIAQKTTILSSMVFTLLIGAQVFAVTFRGLYGDSVIEDFLLDLELTEASILLVVMLLLFLLGFFLDFIEICFIVIPLLGPILVIEYGINPLWLAILVAVNLQTSFLTPPFGFALFYLKGVAPKEISTMNIYRGALPFVFIQLCVLFLLWLFPAIALWLPSVLFPD